MVHAKSQEADAERSIRTNGKHVSHLLLDNSDKSKITIQIKASESPPTQLVENGGREFSYWAGTEENL